MPDKFHDKSKEAGNKLKAYILSFSSVATGVFFFTLTGEDVSSFGAVEKTFLLGAMTFFAATVVLCLLELHIDSRRFFLYAKELEKPEGEQDKTQVRRLKRIRVRVIYASYSTVLMAFLLTFIYMLLRLAG